MTSSPMRGSGWISALIAALLLLPLAACGKRAEKDDTAAAAAPAPAPPALHPLPETAFRVEWGKVEVLAPAVAGKTVPVAVTLKNASDQVWPDKATADPAHTGANAVRLAWRILPA